MFIIIIQAIRSDGSYTTYYTIASETWNGGRFDMFFGALNNLGDCVGGILSRASPYIGCFFTFSVRFAVLVIKTTVQIGFDIFSPSGNIFAEQWNAGAYSNMFSAEEAFFTCFTSPIALLDNNLACVFHNIMEYVISLVKDAVDFAILFRTSVDTHQNMGYLLESSLANGRFNATFTTTDKLGHCLSRVGSVYLGGAGCIIGSAIHTVNGFFRGGLYLFIDISKTAAGSSFSQLFSSSWNAGKYSPAFDGIRELGQCLDNFFSTLDYRYFIPF